MKYLLRPEGNHSNRLFQLAHIVAYCEEYHQPLEILCFDDMAPLYQDGWYCIPKHHNLKTMIWTFLNKVQRRTRIKLLPIVDFCEEDSMQKHPLDSLPKNCIIDGWYFRCNNLTIKYRNYLREKYTLKEDYFKDNKLCQLITTVNRDEYQKVGVHIRRGDNKEFQGG
ncbi:MAG: hypothetical protein J6W76_02735, partial [Spirochaetales bacterium]|nr:hypothetical protein [Spirochaetales bacterium]